MYLMKYGYMDHHHHNNKTQKSAPLLSKDGLRDYVEKFQVFAGKLIDISNFSIFEKNLFFSPS